MFGQISQPLLTSRQPPSGSTFWVTFGTPLAPPWYTSPRSRAMSNDSGDAVPYAPVLPGAVDQPRGSILRALALQALSPRARATWTPSPSRPTIMSGGHRQSFQHRLHLPLRSRLFSRTTLTFAPLAAFAEQLQTFHQDGSAVDGIAILRTPQLSRRCSSFAEQAGQSGSAPRSWRLRFRPSWPNATRRCRQPPHQPSPLLPP